jgi:hypothetical protein
LAAVRDRIGFSVATPTGSSAALLDPSRLMSMQEDARCRKISAEVMKHCLYKSVAPCRRRALNRSSTGGAVTSNQSSSSRAVRSMPATRGPSTATTPMLSPSVSYSFFDSVFSRGATPRATSPITPNCDADHSLPFEDEGLASLFKPRPRYVRASCSELNGVADVGAASVFVSEAQPDSVFLLVPNISNRFRGRRTQMTTSVSAV